MDAGALYSSVSETAYRESREVDQILERFWTLKQEDVNGKLHLPFLRDRMRSDLSEGRSPITLGEVRAHAVEELGYHSAQLHFGEDEASRPLMLLAALWAFRRFPGKATKAKCRSFGQIIGETGGEAAFGPHDKLHAQAWEILQGWQQPTGSPEQTRSVLERVVRHYGFEKGFLLDEVWLIGRYDERTVVESREFNLNGLPIIASIVHEHDPEACARVRKILHDGLVKALEKRARVKARSSDSTRDDV